MEQSDRRVDALSHAGQRQRRRFRRHPQDALEPIDPDSRSGHVRRGPTLRMLKSKGYQGPVGLQCYAIKGDVRDNLNRSKEAWDRLQ